MSNIRIEKLTGPALNARPVEIVERKGLGHPDTICDMLSERLSIALSRHYQDRFGLIHHHNVDKALLSAGRSTPAFGGGEVIEPLDIYLSGRATTEVEGERVPVEELANETVRAWFGENFHALDPDEHIRVHCLVRPGSKELVDLFTRQKAEGVVLANDTSCGAGFAPLSALERMVLDVETLLNAPATRDQLPAAGQDIKVMGIRENGSISLTISCAMIDRYLGGIEAYAEAKETIGVLARDCTAANSAPPVSIAVNAADDAKRGAVFLTVTGTSAESGDDGETGRGNRSNGLITPFRPMTMEAVAGKNPVSHVGKLYNIAAQLIANDLVTNVAEIEEAECYLVSQIGSPIDQPRTVVLRVRSAETMITPVAAKRISQVANERISAIPAMWSGIVEGKYGVV